MIYKIKLKNSPKTVKVDDFVYEYFSTNEYFKNLNFVNNIRVHSSGCAVYQKAWRKPDGTYNTETIYLHKYIAEKWLKEKSTATSNLVGAINGDKLDCRVENLIFRSRSVASRQRKTSSSTGYTGVYAEGDKFRAIIAINKKTVHIGMYDTAEDAALAYNKVSKELYGDDGKVNKLLPPKPKDKDKK